MMKEIAETVLKIIGDIAQGYFQQLAAEEIKEATPEGKRRILIIVGITTLLSVGFIVWFVYTMRG